MAIWGPCPQRGLGAQPLVKESKLKHFGFWTFNAWISQIR